jgi:hypothetical protein
MSIHSTSEFAMRAPTFVIGEYRQWGNLTASAMSGLGPIYRNNQTSYIHHERQIQFGPSVDSARLAKASLVLAPSATDQNTAGGVHQRTLSNQYD